MEKTSKVVLLTGASGGLGTQMANHLYKSGYTLALHCHLSEINIPESEKVQHFQADLGNPDEISAMVDAIVAVFGRLDVLINNAGVSRNGVSWKADIEDWDETIAVNLTAPFLMGKYCIPHMRKNNWGRIINITSVVAQTGFIGTAAYAASKAGLLGLTKTWSKELAAFGITANNLALGYFNTGMIDEVPADIQQEIINSIPLKKLGDPSSINTALDYILEENSLYFTGQTLNLNGGMH
ncbi:MAG: 3-oxoacyl-ACP reductase family protein [Crocinitomicaceae bacterium]